MRIGTWNLEGRWTDDHQHVLREQRCDIWLLTEVAHGTRLQGYAAVVTAADMLPGKAWAAVLSRLPVVALHDPHPASAASVVDGLHVCCSVLPWRSSGGEPPWKGSDQGERTIDAVDAVEGGMPAGDVVWGGDFNHALEGPELAGSAAGAKRIRELLARHALRAPTIGQAHRLQDVRSIDHVAVPSSWSTQVHHEPTPGLSDHDLYVLEALDR